ncbi:MAG: DUF4837 family protein [Cyclobacteriaceae bacterium]
MKNLLILLFAPVILFSCGSATEKVRKDFMPIARGEVDEIILVMDSTQYETELGDELRDMYQQYMRILPQDEYEFTMNKVNPRKLNDVLKNAMNMIFVMTLDSKSLESRTIREYFTDQSLKMIQKDSSMFYTVRRDEFAKGQIVLYLFGQDESQLIENIKDNKSSLKELFASAVRERVREKSLKKLEKEIVASIEEKHGYHLDVPFGWDIAKDVKDFVWVRKLDGDFEQNVFVYEMPYTSKEVFNDITALRDNITELYLRDSQKPKKYITRQPTIPLYTQRITFKGQFAVEARGLWKISDNSAGGPFVSYTFVDQQTQKLYYIEGYVYAAGMKKKALVREVDAILSTFKTNSANKSKEVQ